MPPGPLGFQEIRFDRRLASFENDSRKTPARFNVFSYVGATVIVDYGHNADALVALIDAIGRFPHDRRFVVYTAAGDRRDTDIIRQAEIIGNGFDRVIIYEDKCTRGRPDGEVITLMRQGLSNATRATEIFETRGEFRAIEAGLSMLRTGDLILVQADQVEPSLAFIEQFIGANAGGTGNTAACGCETGGLNGMATGGSSAANGQMCGGAQPNGAASHAETLHVQVKGEVAGQVTAIAEK